MVLLCEQLVEGKWFHQQFDVAIDKAVVNYRVSSLAGGVKYLQLNGAPTRRLLRVLGDLFGGNHHHQMAVLVDSGLRC